MSRESLSLGELGEKLAVSFLRKNGYQILEENYKTRLGEIDIIAREKDTLVFVEVKTRRTQRFGLAQESVTAFKQKQITRVALQFLKLNKLLNKKSRFDVVTVNLATKEAKLGLIRDAFLINPAFSY